ncbi:MAG TPA: ion channel [Pyrinomonadaceae bacterium]|jgi:hypothetical protein|nr:ion channel [Pyrinomonadaceae bacterium]
MSLHQTKQGTSASIDDESSSQGTVYVYTAGGAIVYVVALMCYLKSKDMNAESGWTAVLLFLPVMAQIIGTFFHVDRSHKHEIENRYFYKFSMKVSFFCIAAYCVFWILYSFKYKIYFLSWLAVVIVVLLIGLIGVIMCAFMQPPDTKWRKLNALRIGSANEPLWALSFLFFVIFLDVTFLFGFAFAFHDKYCLSILKQSPPALRMLNSESPDEIDVPAEQVTAPDGAKASEQAGTKAANGESTQSPGTPSANNEERNYYFYFDSYRAHLETGDNEKNLSGSDQAHSGATTQTVDENKIKEKCGLQQVDEKALLSPLPRQNWIMKDTALFNYCSLEQIKRRIKHETAGGKRTRIILVGRSDDQPIAEVGRNRPNYNLQHYQSNYELSEARVQNIRFEINEGLKTTSDTEVWHNIEWLTLPSSNEASAIKDSALDTILSSQAGLTQAFKDQVKDKNKRVVLASIVSIPDDITSLQMKQLSRSQFKELKLMDYMYFSIYTITTTGYGDIIPTTAYSKFVISLANLCEVLFLVVFFNALVSIRGEKKWRQDQETNDTVNGILDLPSK